MSIPEEKLISAYFSKNVRKDIYKREFGGYPLVTTSSDYTVEINSNDQPGAYICVEVDNPSLDSYILLLKPTTNYMSDSVLSNIETIEIDYVDNGEVLDEVTIGLNPNDELDFYCPNYFFVTNGEGRLLSHPFSSGGGSSSNIWSTHVMLNPGSWVDYSQTVHVDNLTSSDIVFVTPSVNYIDAYCNNQVICSSQGDGSLTFSCSTVPDGYIEVSIAVVQNQ